MGRARAVESFAASVPEAEALWYDTGGWPGWVDGLARVTELDGDWPRPGAAVAWESNPAGRGHVLELVVSYQPRAGQTLEIEDASMRGRQSVAFDELDGTVRVELALEYALKQRSIFTPILDFFFIRPAITSSLRSTLAHFGALLAGARG